MKYIFNVHVTSELSNMIRHNQQKCKNILDIKNQVSFLAPHMILAYIPCDKYRFANGTQEIDLQEYFDEMSPAYT